MTVKEVSRRTGISVRTLQHYDNIGLLHPSRRTEAGYRIYEADDLCRLQDILLLRELEFPLQEIRRILNHPGYDRSAAIQDQIRLLEMKRQRLDGIIAFARKLQSMEEQNMDLTVFDRTRQASYAREARERWGSTAAYRESQENDQGRSQETRNALGQGLMLLFSRFGTLRDQSPESGEAQAMVAELRSYITRHYYHCTPQILEGLGQMYVADDRFRENIDTAGGEGTAQFVSDAIVWYCAHPE